MRFNLRFGMHRDIQLMHQEKDLYDGFVIPAHILAYQEASTSAFVTSLPGKGYVIDPMTFILQNRRGVHFNEKGELRPSVRKLCSDYAEELVGLLEGLNGDESLTADDLAGVPDLAKNIAKFQMRKVQAASATGAAAKYLERYAKTKYVPPRYLLTPYYFFEDVNDPWYELSVASARCVLEMKTSVPLAGVVATSPDALTSTGIAQIVEDYSQYGCVFIWLDDFKQTEVGVEAIQCLRTLIRTLVAEGVSVELLYGGYLGALSNYDGLDAISHGILYTTHKSKIVTPGGGGVPERYYIPRFREFRSLSQTELIVQNKPELLCDCHVCKQVVRGNPDRFMRLAADPELLRRHFLAARKKELDVISSGTLEKALDDLNETYSTYNEFVSLLPNPDAYMSEGNMQGLAYLKRWSEAFRNE